MGFVVHVLQAEHFNLTLKPITCNTCCIQQAMCERAPGNGFRRAMHSPTGSMVACGKALGREEGY